MEKTPQTRDSVMPSLTKLSLRCALAFALLTPLLPTTAKADVFGFSLGYFFKPERIAIDLLFPLERNSQQRPKGGVIHFGVDYVAGNAKGQTLYDYNSSGFAIPIGYQHVFKNGIGILIGGEFLYYKSSSNTGNSIALYEDMGGGVILGASYFFESGVFLSFKTATGIITSKVLSKKADSDARDSTFSYATPTFAVGYMF